MRSFDFSSWQSIFSTLAGIAMFALVGIGIRLVMMTTIQQRRERANRQINERLRALIAAYKTLGGSFTGNLAVDPTHRRDLKAQDAAEIPAGLPASDRARRIRDAAEAALSDIILLGTDDQVRLAARAANDLVAGRPVHTHDLVVSLRNYIRSALDLDAIPGDVALPPQGPSRPGGHSGAGRGRGEGSSSGEDQRGGGGRDRGGMGGGAGLGAGMGLGLGLGHGTDDDPGASKGT